MKGVCTLCKEGEGKKSRKGKFVVWKEKKYHATCLQEMTLDVLTASKILLMIIKLDLETSHTIKHVLPESVQSTAEISLAKSQTSTVSKSN